MKQYTILYNQFYYAGLPESGQQITGASVDTKAVCDAVRDLCSGISFTGMDNEERLVYCRALEAFCKVYLRADGRNYFYHCLVPDLKSSGFLTDDPTEADTLGILAALASREPSPVTHTVAPLPQRCEELHAPATDDLPALLQNDEASLASLLACIFRPFLFSGAQVRLSLPAPAGVSASSFEATDTMPAGPSAPSFEATRDMHAAAALLLALLPDSLRTAARLRFSADRRTYTKLYDCTHALFYGDEGADFAFTAPRVLSSGEDSYGIFTALAGYIVRHGMRAYRQKLCPLLDDCLRDSRREGGLLPPLLFLTLKASGLLSLAPQPSPLPALEYYLLDASEDWFNRYAAALCGEMNDAAVCERVREALLQNRNALSERPPAALQGSKDDGFLRTLARTYRFAAAADKENCLAVFFRMLSDSRAGLSLLLCMKTEMSFTHALPSENSPDALFAGTRMLEMTNPAYVQAAMERAATAFLGDGEEAWLYAAQPLLRYEASAAAVRAVLAARFEELLKAAVRPPLLEWLCALCTPALSEERRSAALPILQEKRLDYEDLVALAKTLQLPDDAVPKPPKAARVPADIDTLEKLSAFCRSGAGKKTAAFHNSAVERLLEILSRDCEAGTFLRELPVLLQSLRYTPGTRLHPKLETALCRQLCVLLPRLEGEQKSDCLHMLESLYTQYELCLFCDTENNRAYLRAGGRTAAGLRGTLLRLLPLAALCAAVLLPALCLFLWAPAVSWLPAVFACIGVLLVVLQAILRRETTARYLLPVAMALLMLALCKIII